MVELSTVFAIPLMGANLALEMIISLCPFFDQCEPPASLLFSTHRLVEHGRRLRMVQGNIMWRLPGGDRVDHGA